MTRSLVRITRTVVITLIVAFGVTVALALIEAR